MHTSIHPFSHLFIDSPVHPVIHPSICPSVRPSVRPSVKPTNHPSIHPSTHPFVYRYASFNDVKGRNPSVVTLLAVGGWNFGTQKMTAMLRTQPNRAEFIRTTIGFLRNRTFDGLDLDFEDPGNRGSPPEDKTLFAHLVQVMNEQGEEEWMDEWMEGTTASIWFGIWGSWIRSKNFIFRPKNFSIYQSSRQKIRMTLF